MISQKQCVKHAMLVRWDQAMIAPKARTVPSASQVFIRTLLARFYAKSARLQHSKMELTHRFVHPVLPDASAG
jgi:hypothetical protein